MTNDALKIIHDEHAALAVMLRTMGVLLDAYRKHGAAPDFGLFRAMLFYVDEYPEQLHHQKESALLFPRLRRRAPQLGAVLDRLDRDHARGAAAIRDLEHALLGFEMLGESRRMAFEQALEAFVATCLEHMRIEETEVLPVAESALEPDDWAALDAAFRENRDPLTGHTPQEDYRELFSRIVAHVPAPFGLGPAL